MTLTREEIQVRQNELAVLQKECDSCGECDNCVESMMLDLELEHEELAALSKSDQVLLESRNRSPYEIKFPNGDVKYE